ncbi:MAG: formate dehydrogenase accessory protein FdhE [Thermodesulfovibrionales bacterium]
MKGLIAGRIRINEGYYPPDLVDSMIDEFSLVFDIPSEILSPVKEALRFRQIDFLRIPMNELPTFTFPYLEEDIEEILFLLSKPFFIQMRESTTFTERLTEQGRCPVCRSTPSLSSIQENEERIYYCSYCGFKGQWNRIGCPACLNRKGEDIEIITAEQENGLRLELCLLCKNYIKTFQRNLFSEYSPELIDIMSIPLDIIAQSKGFIRTSPNPIGMRRIV